VKYDAGTEIKKLLFSRALSLECAFISSLSSFWIFLSSERTKRRWRSRHNDRHRLQASLIDQISVVRNSFLCLAWLLSRIRYPWIPRPEIFIRRTQLYELTDSETDPTTSDRKTSCSRWFAQLRLISADQWRTLTLIRLSLFRVHGKHPGEARIEHRTI